ncbi:hypothetical protein KBZ15_12450 [Cyanobium sp. BA20m-p-22]|uniref:hypothetical protein n=1 Tax=unclassified Cyanobium TaxID=2627006 RepID=UPI0020CDCC34|nr:MULTISPECIES: hypothetical protein [unclassified Cyanobium]MCP9910703.1 hypothetical protein [Cyanobium sp. BA20m-p-22]MCP9913400.1 hypothetical protein [Cyanobium sp. BA20m-14]
MLFNRKPAFFLDLGSEGATPAKVAIAEPKPSAAKAAEGKLAAVLAANPAPAPATQPGNQPSSQPSSSQPSLTTAEAIAAELRAAQEALPAPSLATFAPECLNPANALPSRRRLAGANLAGYKAMAAGMFRN